MIIDSDTYDYQVKSILQITDRLTRRVEGMVRLRQSTGFALAGPVQGRQRPWKTSDTEVHPFR